jgi:Ca2+-binding EF-hand superfamily protein
MSARGPGQTAARVCYFDKNKGYQTEGHAMTARLARGNVTARRNEIMQNLRERNAPKGKPTSPAWMKHGTTVLSFKAFFQEGVYESREENYRVRLFRINYFPTDDTISITEEKEENSGIPQGDYVKKARLPKPATKENRSSFTFTSTANRMMGTKPPGPSNFYQARDLAVGTEINVYGKIFKIYDADPYTRNFYRDNFGVALSERGPVPKNNIDHMRMGQGVHDWKKAWHEKGGYFGREDNDVKRYMEAQRGREDRVHADAPGGTRRFLNNHGAMLRFNLFWDDKRVYGSSQRFHMNVYLEDNTIEILYAGSSDGRDAFKALFRRGRLPFPDTVRLGARAWRGCNDNPVRYFEPNDIVVGNTIELLKRKMVVYDCDSFTYKHHLKTYGIDMKKNKISLSALEKEKKPLPKNTPPEWWLKGISTEEETLENWKRLRPNPLKRDENKLVKYEGKILKFKACFTNPKYVPDRARDFIVCYYLADDTVRVFEVPKLNSGISGGKFAMRAKMRNPDTGKYFTTDDFDVNKTITINTFKFTLTEADNFTRAYKSGDYTLHKTLSVSEVETMLREKVAKAAVNIRKSFRKADKDFSGYIDYEEFRIMLEEMGIHMTEKDLITLMRKYDHDGQGEISYAEFCQAFIPKDYVEKGKSAHAAYHDASGEHHTFDADDYLAHMSKVGGNREKERRVDRLLTELAMAFFSKGRESDARKAFKTFDVDSSGNVDRYEFACALKSGVGVRVDDDDIELLEDVFFGDDIEELSYTSFIDFLRKKYNDAGQF